jgi:hypothetical protein
MAFGKKKDDAPTPEAEDVAELDAPEEASGPLASVEAALEPTPTDEPPADESAAPDTAAAVPAEAPGTDALLSMFQESKTEVNDLAVLVDMAGEADIDDILEELRTLRAALGITDSYDEEDFAAAA